MCAQARTRKIIQLSRSELRAVLQDSLGAEKSKSPGAQAVIKVLLLSWSPSQKKKEKKKDKAGLPNTLPFSGRWRSKWQVSASI